MNPPEGGHRRLPKSARPFGKRKDDEEGTEDMISVLSVPSVLSVLSSIGGVPRKVLSKVSVSREREQNCLFRNIIFTVHVFSMLLALMRCAVFAENHVGSHAICSFSTGIYANVKVKSDIVQTIR